jgi:hypothetical protein
VPSSPPSSRGVKRDDTERVAEALITLTTLPRE